MFKGGGPGQPGNTLMAVGKGFMFKKAVLEFVELSDDPDYDYKTTYINGVLMLNPKGPWLKKGKLKATGITAINYSKMDTEGVLQFKINMCGEFDKEPDTFFQIEATYEGSPEIKYDDYGDPVFQRGTDFSATITIEDFDLCE